MKVGKDEWVY